MSDTLTASKILESARLIDEGLVQTGAMWIMVSPTMPENSLYKVNHKKYPLWFSNTPAGPQDEVYWASYDIFEAMRIVDKFECKDHAPVNETFWWNVSTGEIFVRRQEEKESES